MWLLDEYNNTFPNAFLSKQDNGIDIIGETSTGWHAIQCKYRNRALRVDWKSLSTFIAMCERTRPCDERFSSWEKNVVITNCIGVTHKLPRTPKDKSICRKTLQNTSRDHWLRIIGKDNFQRIDHSLTENFTITADDPQIKNLTLNIIRSPQLSLEDLRNKRLQYLTMQQTM